MAKAHRPVAYCPQLKSRGNENMVFIMREPDSIPYAGRLVYLDGIQFHCLRIHPEGHDRPPQTALAEHYQDIKDLAKAHQ